MASDYLTGKRYLMVYRALVVGVVLSGCFFGEVGAQVCGNGVWEAGETVANCLEDCWTENLPEADILAGADSRIAKYRKGLAVLHVQNSDHTPVSNAQIEIKQTGHEFLFGLNHAFGMWEEIFEKKLGFSTSISATQPAVLTEQQLDAYLEQARAFSNNLNIPLVWQFYESADDTFATRDYDAIIGWAEQGNHYQIRFGHLVWNNSTPSWVPADCNQLVPELEEMVRHVGSRYRGRLDYINVVNEVTTFDRAIFADVKMTPCIAEVGKVEWAKKWLKVAREEDPLASLVINEVAILPEQGFSELLDALKEDEKPLYDVIGIQSHMHSELWPLWFVWGTADRYGGYGVPVQFTETTVLSGTPMSGADFGMVSTAQGEAAQRDYLVHFYKTLFSHPAVSGITWWNLSDHYSWKDAPAGLLRADMSAKPAYAALMDLIYQQWRTEVQTISDSQGNAPFTGFYGQYEITVTFPGDSEKFTIAFLKNQSADFNLVRGTGQAVTPPAAPRGLKAR